MSSSEDECRGLAMAVATLLQKDSSDVGKVMFEAYRRVVVETDPKIQVTMLNFIEAVRIAYIEGVK